MRATKETTTPPKQEAAGTHRPPSEGGRLLFHREKLSKPGLPNLAPKRADSQPDASENYEKQPQKKERKACKGAKTPQATPKFNPSPESTKGQPPGSVTTHEPDGQILAGSAITGFIEFTSAVTSETN